MTPFQLKGFHIVKNFIDTKKYYKEALKTVDSTPGSFDEQSPNSPAYYGKPTSFAQLHNAITPQLEKITGYQLYKTYFYWRMYYHGAILNSHTDRQACEISGTLFLGGAPWDIVLRDSWGIERRIYQSPGDLLLYKGCELPHWRDKFILDQHAQLFLHYVNKNGPNAWAKDDILKEVPISNR